MRDDPATPPVVTHLDGFIYDELHPLLDVRDRLAWLSRQPDGYRPLPYEQFAHAYRRVGHDADARRVLLALAEQPRQTAMSPRHMSFPARVWGVVQDWAVGYGYLRVVRQAGCSHWPPWVQCCSGHPPVRIQQRPRFSPLVYALDVLLPVVNFGQEHAFTPADPVGQWLTYSLVAAGWILDSCST